MADPIDLVHLLVTLVLLIAGLLLITDGVAGRQPPEPPNASPRH